MTMAGTKDFRELLQRHLEVNRSKWLSRISDTFSDKSSTVVKQREEKTFFFKIIMFYVISPLSLQGPRSSAGRSAAFIRHLPLSVVVSVVQSKTKKKKKEKKGKHSQYLKRLVSSRPKAARSPLPLGRSGSGAEKSELPRTPLFSKHSY